MRLVFVRESDLETTGDAMTTAIFSDGRPMTEAEFLAIDETPERIELFDGSLHVTPGPNPRHQKISRRLANALDPGADAVGLQALEGVNIRLAPNRITIPDVAITTDIDLDEAIIDVTDVRFVCEIISPSNPATDKVLKMHYYAAAGIAWYLLVEPRARTFNLYRLAGSTYVEHAFSEGRDVLRLTDPVTAVLDPEVLLPPR
jgi:Uma2 family endonuclease